MPITPAFAQAGAGGDTNSMLMSLLPFALIFVIMYFLILRPQQKKVKDHAELVKNIRRGDTVVTTGGLVGKVTKVVDDDQIEFEISDGVRVRQPLRRSWRRREGVFFGLFLTFLRFLMPHPYRAFGKAASASKEGQMSGLAALQLGPRPL